MANFAVRSSHLNTHSRVECVNQFSICVGGKKARKKWEQSKVKKNNDMG